MPEAAVSWYVRAVTRWKGYWFADGGRLAAAIVRIGIATSVIIALLRLWEKNPLVAPDALYRPIGPWMLLGHTPPPDALISVIWVLAWTGTIAMLLGFYTRAATAVSFGAAMSLAAISFSGSTTWSHQYNVVFLTQCAFLGARGGDTLSVDAWLRKRRGLPPCDVPRGYQWSLRLVQLAVALMFAGAVFHKILMGHGTLRWALSDSLRNHLLVRFDLAGLDRPAVVDWIIDDVWKYRIAALLNLVTQATPILAVIFVRKPLVRALAGLAFLIETIALGLVVALWNPAWIPLVCVFIDWDWLFRRPAPPPAPADYKPPRGPQIFIIAFFAYELLTSFIPTVDQRLNTFPFSSFPMFATIRAEPPYSEHKDYVVPGDHIEPIGPPTHKFAQRWLDHTFRGLYAERDTERIKGKLQQIVDLAPIRYPDASIPGVRAYLSLFVAPAYPAPAHFEEHSIAILAELHPGGAFKTVLGSLSGTTVTLKPQGVDTKGDVKLLYYKDDRPTPIDLAVASRSGDTFTLASAPAGHPVYVVAVIAGQPWLVASAK